MAPGASVWGTPVALAWVVVFQGLVGAFGMRFGVPVWKPVHVWPSPIC